MKDYTLGEKLFILNYSKNNDELILHLNNGEKVHVLYTLENEKQILKTMEEQLLDARKNNLTEKIKKDNTKAKEKFFKTILSIVGGMSLITLAIAVVLGPAAPSFYTILGTILLTVGPAIKYNKNAIKNYLMLKDYDKNEYYINNSRELEKYDSKENKTMILDKSSKKTKEVLKKLSTNPEIPSINISSIDKMSLEDLKNIRKNILDYCSKDVKTFLEEKGISYTKK